MKLQYFKNIDIEKTNEALITKISYIMKNQTKHASKVSSNNS